MTTEEIRTLIAQDKLWKFYKTPEWQRLKAQVLADAHYECAICKQQGKITRYETGTDGKRRRICTVHHVNEVRKHPELALSRYYVTSAGEELPNLVAICKDCHNKIHDRTFTGRAFQSEHFVNEERW